LLVVELEGLLMMVTMDVVVEELEVYYIFQVKRLQFKSIRLQ
jgi:hypothetical protein